MHHFESKRGQNLLKWISTISYVIDWTIERGDDWCTSSHFDIYGTFYSLFKSVLWIKVQDFSDIYADLWVFMHLQV